MLEPFTADVDQALDEALAAGPPAALDTLSRFADSLTAAQVRWALDGRSAVVVQGLALPHHELGVALVDDDVSRRRLRTQQAQGLDRQGFSLAPSWYESPEQVRLHTREPVYCLLGVVHVRIVEELPSGVLPLSLDGRVVPVLPLAEVRRAHSALADLLDRHEHRLAEQRGRRTV